MESRWYLAPGQTLENTNISDRGHALHVTAPAWDKITAHLDRKKIIADAIEKERQHKQALKEGSHNMTKNWSDSIEFTHKRKEEERKTRFEELESQRMETYNQLRKEQEEIKEEYIKRVKNSMYYQQAYPKMLNGALMESEAIYERKKQQAFKEMIKRHDIEEERKYAERIKQAAEDEKREKEEEAKANFKKKMELKNEYLTEMGEKEKMLREMKARKQEKELMDNHYATIEMELQAQIKQEDMMKERAERRKELLDYLNNTNEFKRLLKKEDDEVDEVIKVFEVAKQEIECLRKEKMDEHRREEVARREAASKRAVADARAREEEFERILKKAQHELDEKAEEKRQQGVARLQQLRRDREEDHRHYLRRKEDEDKRIKEVKKWEMLNRLKSDEVMKEYEQDKKMQDVEKKVKYRKELETFMEALKYSGQVGDQDKKKADEYLLNKLKKGDQEFFDYANKLIDYANENERTIYPIVNVIKQYKKENNIPEDQYITFGKKDCGSNSQRPKERMLNTTPGKRCHHPRTDPNYRRCRCHKDEIIK